MATVRGAIDAKVKEYIDLYEAFRADDKFCNQAKSLALHDVALQKYIWEKVEGTLQEYIRVREGEGL